MKKEQSSILTPNNDLIGVKKSEKKEEAKIPKPTGWRLLVLPFKMKEKTKGGLVLAESTLEKQHDDEVLATIDSPEDILHEF